MFDKRYFKSARFQIPVISVGNLSVGGTGKSPHVAYLVALLQQQYKVGSLSRGYGRKTREYHIAQMDSTAEQVGDEPLMLKLKYPNTQVVVGIDRLQTIPRMIADAPDLDVIILDDAFQHRSVRAGLSILLTDYSNLFTDDFLLPAGRLRERRKGYHRADIIVVTKCPESVDNTDRERILKQLKPFAYQHVYFSSIRYGNLYPLFNFGQENAWRYENYIENGQQFYRLVRNEIKLKDNCLLVTGIANAAPLEKELRSSFKQVYAQHYADHHHFDDHDLEVIRTAHNDIGAENCMIVTTEKDAVRLLKFREWFTRNNIQVYCQPIEVKFIGEDASNFNADVQKYVTHDLNIYKPVPEEESTFDNILE